MISWNIFEKLAGMEQILQALGKSTWKTALEKMQQVNLSNDLHTERTELQKLVAEQVYSSKQLGLYLKAARKTVATPLTILKQAVFLHLHLQLTPSIKAQLVNDFLSLLQLRCSDMVELYGEGQIGESSSKCARSQATTREDEAFQGKEVFLISKIVRPYLRYLQRLVSSFDQYRGLAVKEEAESALVWRLVNLLRGVTGITGHFVMIGRYFMQDYGGAVVLLTGVLSNDITLYINLLRKYVRKQRHELTCYSASESQLQEFVSVLNELTLLNEQLMAVYFGKYFFRELRDLQQPEWINPNIAEFDTIYKIAEKHSKTQCKPRMRQGSHA